MADAGRYRYWAAPPLDRNWQAALGARFAPSSEAQAELKIVDRYEPAPANQGLLLLTDEPPGAVAENVAVLPVLATPDVLREVARLLVERLRWRQAAYTDALTGLPNRRAWAQAIAEADRSLHAWAVAILDLDQFKRVNESAGYAAGDRLLAAVAACWREHLPPACVLARIGGDEFGVLLPAEQSEAIEKLRGSVAEAASGLTASAGYATAAMGSDLAATFDRADAALRKAKQAGANRTMGAAD
jgi:diguanylate cyclase (GGDEF)-like protein